MTNANICRFCGQPLTRTFADLGVTPISNAFLRADQLNAMEPFYPLHAYVCDACLLVQLHDFESPEQYFNEHYAYFSSYSDTWLAHARDYTRMMHARLDLNDKSFVVEVASNDGYLLQYFVQERVPCLGIEPSRNVADVARSRGIDTLVAFFTADLATKLAAERRKADLILGNNVLAHVPRINDFVEGLRILLDDEGVATMEFPHLLRLMEGNQFDTIYHEHFSYLSLLAVRSVFAAHGLRIFDVERLPTHGGSLRVFAAHKESRRWKDQPAVETALAQERDAGLDRPDSYSAFARRINRTKRELLTFLVEAKNAGKTIVGYGAPAKGNTLLNFCGIRTDFLDYTVDRSPHKQGMFLPGTRIPIERPEKIFETKPDYVLILPWNLQDEIVAQMSEISAWGGKFVVPIPHVRVLE